MLNTCEFKEYNIKDVWKLRKKLLLISPTGKIYVFKHDNFDNQLLNFLHYKHVNLDKVIDKICEEFYQRGIEISSINLKNTKEIIINLFGFVIYDYSSLTLQYSNKNCIYEELTKIQLKILSKLCKRDFKKIFSIEEEETYETEEISCKNLCYNKRKITKKRIN